LKDGNNRRDKHLRESSPTGSVNSVERLLISHRFGMNLGAKTNAILPIGHAFKELFHKTFFQEYMIPMLFRLHKSNAARKMHDTD
jgi:hypothetical protein